jgi:hypothetical protein
VAPVIAGYWERAEFPHALVPGFAQLGLAGGPLQGHGCPVRAGAVMGGVRRTVWGGAGAWLRGLPARPCRPLHTHATRAARAGAPRKCTQPQASHARPWFLFVLVVCDLPCAPSFHAQGLSLLANGMAVVRGDLWRVHVRVHVAPCVGDCPHPRWLPSAAPAPSPAPRLVTLAASEPYGCSALPVLYPRLCTIA